MKLAGVVVLYNPDKEVLKNINTYIDYVDVLYAIDNTPNKNNSSMFKNDKIEYICNNENLGIAEALNIAAKKAINKRYQWLLTMDQDSMFNKNDMKIYYNHLQELVKEKRTFDNLPIESIGLFSPFHDTIQTKALRPSGISYPLLVMTSGNIINLKAYKNIGGFKSWLFIDCVDFDYCLNLRINGYEIIQFNDVVLDHHIGNTKEKHFFGKTFYVSNHNKLRKYYMARNRKYIYDMYHDYYPIYCEAEVKSTKTDIFKVIFFERNKISKIIYMIRGLKDYKKGKTGKYEKFQ